MVKKCVYIYAKESSKQNVSNSLININKDEDFIDTIIIMSNNDSVK